LATLLVIPLLSSFPVGQKVINMLPFIGKTDTENVDYRVKLLDNAYIVFNRYPLFGSTKYRDELADLGMLQGEGIVDVVNTYLDVVLEYGLVGLILYISFFSIVLTAIYRGIKKAADKRSEQHLVGRVLLATLVAILLTITTVSSILIIPVVYWAFAGLGIAFSQLKKVQTISEVTTNEVLPTYRLATKT
jgi:O-antigen ligase